MGPAPAVIEGIVDDALGRSVETIERPSNGRIADTYLLTLDGGPGDVVCKLGGASVRTGAVIEPLVIDLVADGTDVPVPQVIASGTLSDDQDTRWSLYETVPGGSPTPFPAVDPRIRRSIVDRVGSLLAELHRSFEFDGIGAFGRRGDQLTIERPIEPSPGRWGKRFVESEIGNVPADPTPVLAHGDLFPDNLLVDDAGAITALLDWGNAHVTTRGYALARAEMRFVDWFGFSRSEKERMRSALRCGYETRTTLPPDYPRFSRLYKAVWLTQMLVRQGIHLGSARRRAQLRRHLGDLIDIDR